MKKLYNVPTVEICEFPMSDLLNSSGQGSPDDFRLGEMPIDDTF